MLRKRTPPLAAAFLLLTAALSPAPVAAREIQLIRDTEIENIIRAYATPLFQASGLSPQDIDVYLVQDPSLNAFATSGLNMFLYTGLLMRADDPLQVIGVIAHETGHLAAGHTATRGDAQRSSAKTVIASYILGLGAALATGRGQLAGAIVSGGKDIALKGLLNYTRSQEAAADQIAVQLLNGTGQSPRGLLDFLRILGGQEVLLSSRQDPYLRTHPLTQDRIAFIEEQLRRSPSADRPARPEYVEMHARMQAKLVGFLLPRSQVLQRYPESDTSLPARYARAIAQYRAGGLDAALVAVDALIAEHPDDPYFHELRGQMLFEHGRIAEAVTGYEAAVERLPEAPQLRLALAQAQIELNDPSRDATALGHLNATLRREPGNAFAWRLAAIAHGRQGDVGMTALALAESALAGGRAEDARDQAVRAQKILSEGTPAWLRARDLEQLAARLAKERSEGR